MLEMFLCIASFGYSSIFLGKGAEKTCRFLGKMGRRKVSDEEIISEIRRCLERDKQKMKYLK